MWSYKTPGVPDDLFVQSDSVPGPTKEEIRVLTISKARLCEGSTVVDVGCGTGGLTVEAALQVAPKGKVYAFDEDAEAVELTAKNAAKFSVDKVVQIKKGQAPEILADLPSVDAFIVGGSRNLPEVIKLAHQKLKSGGRIVVNTILLETAYIALEELKVNLFKDVEAVEVFVAKGRQVNAGTMMLARNPITVISGTK